MYISSIIFIFISSGNCTFFRKNITSFGMKYWFYNESSYRGSGRSHYECEMLFEIETSTNVATRLEHSSEQHCLFEYKNFIRVYHSYLRYPGHSIHGVWFLHTVQYSGSLVFYVLATVHSVRSSIVSPNQHNARSHGICDNIYAKISGLFRSSGWGTLVIR